jgi:hypothetical protein
MSLNAYINNDSLAQYFIKNILCDALSEHGNSKYMFNKIYVQCHRLILQYLIQETAQ